MAGVLVGSLRYSTCLNIALANGGLAGDSLTLIREEMGVVAQVNTEMDPKLLQNQVGTYLH
jgi:hypothetical protein